MTARRQTCNPTTSAQIALVLAVAFASSGCSGVASQAPGPAPSQTATAPAAVAPSTSTTPAASAVATPAEGAATSVDLSRLKLGTQLVADGFASPLYVTNAHDGTGRLFVVEQGGTVRVVRAGRALPQAFLDLSGSVSTGGERGLLGLAFSPGFAADGRFYVNYTNQAGDTVVQRITLADPKADNAAGATRQTVLTVAQPYPNHNGGCLQFGPDGYLYVGMGDGGSAGDPGNRAQSGGVLLGKILRLDTGDAPGSTSVPATYRIPPSNPFVGRAGFRPEIWMLGLRNPWRFTFDAANGDQWIGDVGQDAWEEIDFAKAGVGGLNWGWNVWEGNHRYSAGPAGPRSAYQFPIAEYAHPLGESVTGGYVYRGVAQPALYGTYLYGDYVAGWIAGIRRVSASGVLFGQPQRARLLDTGYKISSFGVDEVNELYLTDWRGGALYRVTATPK